MLQLVMVQWRCRSLEALLNAGNVCMGCGNIRAATGLHTSRAASHSAASTSTPAAVRTLSHPHNSSSLSASHTCWQQRCGRGSSGSRSIHRRRGLQVGDLITAPTFWRNLTQWQDVLQPQSILPDRAGHMLRLGQPLGRPRAAAMGALAAEARTSIGLQTSIRLRQLQATAAFMAAQAAGAGGFGGIGLQQSLSSGTGRSLATAAAAATAQAPHASPHDPATQQQPSPAAAPDPAREIQGRPAGLRVQEGEGVDDHSRTSVSPVRLALRRARRSGSLFHRVDQRRSEPQNLTPSQARPSLGPSQSAAASAPHEARAFLDGNSALPTSPHHPSASSSTPPAASPPSVYASATSQTAQPPAAAPPASDAHISRLIAAARTLPDAESVLYQYGRLFRSHHVAQLLACLPSLDAGGPNAGPRLSRIATLLSHGLMDTADELEGPVLALCLWSLARLGYAPPAVLPVLLEQLAGSWQPLASAAAAGAGAGHGHGVPLRRQARSRGARLSGREQEASGAAAASGLGAGRKVEQLSFGQLADVAWSLARLQVLLGVSAPSSAAAASGASNLPAHLGPAALVERTWRAVTALGLQRPNQATGEELARMAWAAAKTGRSGADVAALFDAIAVRAVDLCCLYPPNQSATASSWPSSTSPRLGLGPSTSAPNGRRMSPALPLGSGQGQRRGGEAGGGAADAVDAVAAEQEAREAQAQTAREAVQSEVALRVERAALLPAARRDQRPSGTASQTLGLSPTAITNLAWAFAMQGQRQPKLFAALAKAAVPQKGDFDLSSLSTLVWAFAAFDLYDEPLLTAVAKKACRRIRHFTPEQLSRLFWSYACLKHYDPVLMERLKTGLQEITAKGRLLRPQEASNLVWALSQLQPHGPKRSPPSSSTKRPRFLEPPGRGSAMGLLIPHLARRRPGDLAPHELSNLLWCVAVAAAAQPKEAARHLARLEGELPGVLSGAWRGGQLRSRGEEGADTSHNPPDSQSSNERGRDRSRDQRAGAGVVTGARAEAGAAAGAGARRGAEASSLFDLLPDLLQELSAAPVASFSGPDLLNLRRAELLLRRSVQLTVGPKRLVLTLRRQGDSGSGDGSANDGGALGARGVRGVGGGSGDGSKNDGGRPRAQEESGAGSTDAGANDEAEAAVRGGVAARQSEQEQEVGGGIGSDGSAVSNGSGSGGGTGNSGNGGGFATATFVGGRRIWDVSSCTLDVAGPPSHSTAHRNGNDSSGGGGGSGSGGGGGGWWEDDSCALLPPQLSQAAAQAAAADPGGNPTPAVGSGRGATGALWKHEVLLCLEELGHRPRQDLPLLGGAVHADLAVLDEAHMPVAVQREGRKHYSRSTPHVELGGTVLERRLLQLAGCTVVSVPGHVWKVWDMPEEQVMYLCGQMAEAGVPL